jgi:hypothetical protein
MKKVDNQKHLLWSFVAHNVLFPNMHSLLIASEAYDITNPLGKNGLVQKSEASPNGIRRLLTQQSLQSLLCHPDWLIYAEMSGEWEHFTPQKLTSPDHDLRQRYHESVRGLIGHRHAVGVQTTHKNHS